MERGRENISSLEKIKKFCEKFDRVNLVKNNEGFVAEVLDKSNEQQAVYVFDIGGNLIAANVMANALQKVIGDLMNSELLIIGQKESSDAKPLAKPQAVISNIEGRA